MNLKISFPKGVAESDVLFSLPYDIGADTKKTSGHVVATEKNILVYENDLLIKEYKYNELAEITVEQLIGCSMLTLRKHESKSEFVCAFTQSYFMHYSELAKIIEHYLQTGEFLESDDTPEPTCPKCGAKLNGSDNCVYCSDNKGIFLKLIKRLAPHKWKFLISLLMTVIVYAGDVIIPYLQRILIDDMIVPNNKDMELFFKVAFVIFAINASGFLFKFIRDKYNYLILTAYGRELRQDLFEKTQRLSASNISRRTPGEIINRVSSDARTVQDFVTVNGKDMILQIISLIALLAVMFMTNWQLTLMIIIPVPLAFYLATKSFNILSIRYGRSWRMRCRSSELLHDILHGIRVVKNYGCEKREIEAYEKSSKLWATAAKKAEIMWYFVQPPISLVYRMGEYAALFFGGIMILNGKMPLGELVQFTAYVYMLYNPIRWLTTLPRMLAQVSVSAGKLFEILEEKDDITEDDNAVNIDIKGDISFKNVTFGYTPYNPVLKDITFDIKAGEMIGIVGHSGVGKSTLINLVMRLYDTTSGNLEIDGTDIRKISQHSLRSQVGVVLQETVLFNGSVFENIRYAKPDASFEEVVLAAKAANCHDFVVRLPDGYNTYVGERGYNLSGGERQRIAIARAILHNPKIIILDEATASLDTQTEKQIQEALSNLTKGRTTIAIAHRLSTLSGADRLLVLDKGKIAEYGTHSELLRNKGVYYKLVMAQKQTAGLKKARELAQA